MPTHFTDRNPPAVQATETPAAIDMGLGLVVLAVLYGAVVCYLLYRAWKRLKRRRERLKNPWLGLSKEDRERYEALY